MLDARLLFSSSLEYVLKHDWKTPKKNKKWMIKQWNTKLYSVFLSVSLFVVFQPLFLSLRLYLALNIVSTLRIGLNKYKNLQLILFSSDARISFRRQICYVCFFFLFLSLLSVFFFFIIIIIQSEHIENKLPVRRFCCSFYC